MDTGSAALVFFYGLFWATVISATARYRAFPTSLAMAAPRHERPRYWRRLGVSLLLLNFVPAGLLLLLYATVVPAAATPRAIASAALSSLSVFGVHRVYHAAVCSRETWKPFYSEAELTRYDLNSPELAGSPWWAHLVPGVAYLLLWPLLACLVATV
jgi:hypothetical protein